MASTALRCWRENSGCAKAGSGGGGGGGGGIASTASVPSSTRPSITPELTPASRAASDLPCSSPSDSTSISRRRAGVMRRGGSPTSRTPVRIRSGPKVLAHPQRSCAAPCRAPTACKLATQSTSARSSGCSGGTSSFSPTSFSRLCRRGSGFGIFRPHHRDHFARTEGHCDDIAGLELHAARHAIGIGLIERDRHQHIDDTRRCGGRSCFRGWSDPFPENRV